MKKLMIMMALVCCLALVGCGNKSKEELTDIEQFRCQDSIQTVFDVLGETELETDLFEAEYYEYENLNLWGYNGDAIFSVRDNKDTIQSFRCHLVLNNKEFEELLLIFSDKYGSYEVRKREYENSEITTYEWKIDEEKSEELGCSSIRIQYNGDKKYTVYFSDEWSIKDDGEYYKHLEEKEETKNASEEKAENIIASKKYKVDGEDVGIALSETKGIFEISVIGNAKDEEKASIMLACYKMYLDEIDLDKYIITIMVNEGSVVYSVEDGENSIFGRNKDGSLAFSSPDWIVTDFTMTEEEMNSFSDEIINTIKDFGESAGMDN